MWHFIKEIFRHFDIIGSSKSMIGLMQAQSPQMALDICGGSARRSVDKVKGGGGGGNQI